MNAEDKAIVYDDSCPMCRLYTQGFVQAGMLKANNRVAFSCLQELPVANQLDITRSRHEIPLIDLKGRKTLYGLDSLLFMISCRMPILASIGRFAPLYWLFKYVYAFVSYNRRVIIQAKKASQGGYRIAFILLAMTVGCYGFGIDARYVFCLSALHYALPFLGKYQRTELLGQLAASVLIGVFFLSFHTIIGRSVLAVGYVWRLKHFVFNT